MPGLPKLISLKHTLCLCMSEFRVKLTMLLLVNLLETYTKIYIV